CGKTTLLRSLSGLIPVTDGSVLFQGQSVTRPPEGLALVFQDYSRSLMPWLSVRANIGFPLRRLVKDKAERNQRIEEALFAVGMEDAGSKYPWQLSGGMQQRVAIARALAYQPKVLLMDEPFASVDAYTRTELEDLILRVKKMYNMTILFVTHDVDEAVYLGNRVIVLSRIPTLVAHEFVVDLPDVRDQVETKELSEFVQLRGEVARAIRGVGENTKTTRPV